MPQAHDIHNDPFDLEGTQGHGGLACQNPQLFLALIKHDLHSSTSLYQIIHHDAHEYTLLHCTVLRTQHRVYHLLTYIRIPMYPHLAVRTPQRKKQVKLPPHDPYNHPM